MVSVQLFRTPGSGESLSYICKVQTPEIGTLSKGGVYVLFMSSAPPPM